MSQRPTTLSQLLSRLAAPAAAEQMHAPVIAAATEIGEISEKPRSPQWVILHSATNANVQLIHPRPLSAGGLDVEILVASGEILRVALETAESHKKGDLYESTAQFLQ